MRAKLSAIALSAALPVSLALLVSGSGCSSTSNRVTADGNVAEWGGGSAATADSNYLYARFSFDETFGTLSTPQSSDSTTRVSFDLDNDPETGKRLEGGPVGLMGVDLEILLSPRPDEAPGTRYSGNDGGVRSGSSVVSYDAGGMPTVIPQGAVDLVQAPTHFSDWYEVRISRTAAVLGDTPIRDGGEARAITLRTTRAARSSDSMTRRCSRCPWRWTRLACRAR